MNVLELLLLALPIAAMFPLIRALGASPSTALPLAVGVGLGASSIALFASLLAGSRVLLMVFDSALVAVAVLAAARLKVAAAAHGPWRTAEIAGCAALVLAASAASATFFANAFARPHGEWDAWAIWNLRARFLARAGSAWRDAFSPELSWSHPDYPLLLPAAVARVWTYVGATPTAVPLAVALLFAAATVAMLYGALRDLRGRGSATLAALALLGTPLFVQQAARQYADVPLGFFFVATLALLAAADHAAERSAPAFLAGLTAGLAAWTKNEGLLFVFLVVVVRAATAFAGGSAERTVLRRFALGLVPAGCALVLFKLLLAPAGDRFDEPWAEVWLRLTTPARYVAVTAGLAAKATGLLRWLGPALIAYSFLAGLAPAEERRRSTTAAVVVVLMLAGYVLTYVVTADDLAWQIRGSGDRLLVQLLPSALFAFFAAAAAPSASELPIRQRR